MVPDSSGLVISKLSSAEALVFWTALQQRGLLPRARQAACALFAMLKKILLISQ
jgi:hypothetical protein